MANSLEKRKYFFIYKTTNLINGKYYIGMHSTNNLKDGYLGSGTYLRRSIRKYGKENFKCEILEFCRDREELVRREKELVHEELIKDLLCMNLKVGGIGGNTGKNGEHLGGDSFAAAHKYWSKEENKERRLHAFKTHAIKMKTDLVYRQKITIKLKGRQTFKGKSHTEEAKKKISLANSTLVGDKNSQYGTCWITNGKENKKIKKDKEIPSGFWKGRILL